MPRLSDGEVAELGLPALLAPEVGPGPGPAVRHASSASGRSKASGETAMDAQTSFPEITDLETPDLETPDLETPGLETSVSPIRSDSYSLDTPAAPDSIEALAPDDSAADAQDELLLRRRASAAPSPSPTACLAVEIPECTLVSPRSCYEPFDAGVPAMSETQALAALASVWKRLGRPSDDIDYDLDDFAVYCDTRAYPCEMKSLHLLDTRMGLGCFFFDGILSIGGEASVFVRRVPILALPIGNYGAEHHTARGHIWLQSHLNRHRSIYYRLGNPVREYARFFGPMLWVVDLAKHFVDYLQVTGSESGGVGIHHFRRAFLAWLRGRHAESPHFDEWRRQHPSTDFRSSVVANIDFLHKEAVGVLGYRAAYAHPIWSQAHTFTHYIPEPAARDPRTVVTQYMYDLFKDVPFGDQLTVVPMCKETEALRNKLILKRRLELPSALHLTPRDVSSAAAAGDRIRRIRLGDTISTPRDDEASGSMWKREVARGFHDVDRWFALVQAVHTGKDGTRFFDVIWYYRPIETLCGVMKYPWNNELFLSDHCSCLETHKIREDQVLGVHDVEFGGTSTTTAEMFCRQTYINVERKWITLEPEHMRCRHVTGAPRPTRYRPGDTLLVHIDTASPLSEPCELVTSYEEAGRTVYRLRRLLRRADVDAAAGAGAAPPNELVYSACLVEGRRRRIVGRCHVRFFPTGAEIPAPYDRDGVGGYFFLSRKTTQPHGGAQRCEPLESAPPGLRQGWDPAAAPSRLRGLDLFCGGGNFGRGLEDGGGIEMRWANDYDARAVHTYMANVDRPDRVAPFLGSVDDLQRRAIEGRFAAHVPAVGDVDFISAGSPCPGFSRLTNDKTTAQQRKNQSLVAAFGSFVDLYRPRDGLLENVPGIVQKQANRDQDIFSQLICAVVGLGYQAQFFFLDASSCGSAQRRSRVFLALAAPGCRLPAKPPATHSHPPMTKSLGLGLLPNGESMAERDMPSATPFKFVAAREATADLPVVGDAKPDICVAFPDHRVSLGMTRSVRTRISLIPKQPWGMDFARAWYGAAKKPGAGVLTPAERASFRSKDSDPAAPGAANRALASLGAGHVNSRAYGRMYPNQLLGTIITTPNPGDHKNGRSLHWAEDRPLTVMEARRAQGVRDDEMLLGSTAAQYKIVGNSVAREVAVTLGLSFRDAWAATLAGHTPGDSDVDDYDKGSAPEAVAAAAAARPSTRTLADDDAGELGRDAPWRALGPRGSSTPSRTASPSASAPPLPAPTAATSRKRPASPLTARAALPRGKRPRRQARRAASVALAEPSPLGRAVVTPECGP